MVDDLFDIQTPAPPSEADEEALITVILRVHVQPGAGRSAATGRYGNALKVRVAAAPEGGRANQATVSLIASLLGVKEAQIDVVSGASSRAKRLQVEGVTLSELRRLLTEAVAFGNAGQGPGVGRTAH